ncbi:MAG TPA: DUF3089 domain-containing protein [Acidimicrobiia bacterium]|nr:DUF3089 domain-containing protein [Acidimicrobiia bacterium]
MRARDGRVTAVAVAAALLATALGPAGTTAAAPAQQSSSTVWLCRPGLANNPCENDLTTTVVQPDGTQKVVRADPAKRPPVDCFYVYPSVSAQPTVNANLNVDPELTAVAEYQASRFSQTCRVFAPVYPQLTVVATSSAGEQAAEARATAYQGVLSAWRDYLAHDNKGRGVVFIGHSQGAGMLTQLLSSEIDPNPKLRRRLVSALLLGGNVTVAAGRDSGGDFQNIRACHRREQTGCVVAYSTFDQPPPPNSLFGRVGGGVSARTGEGAGLDVLCVNPAAPGGGNGALDAYRRTTPIPGPIGGVVGQLPSAATPWVRYPNLYTAKCESANGATWLQVTDVGGSTDQRLRFQYPLGPAWGLHLADVNIALGNLVDLVRKQAAAYAK